MTAHHMLNLEQVVLAEQEPEVRLVAGPKDHAAGKSMRSAARHGDHSRRRNPAGTTKILRILQLINILRSGECFSADELASKMGISRRTAFRDVETLSRSGIPCRFDPNRRGYRINEWQFLPPSSLNLSEALGLYMAAAKVVHSKAFPFAAEARQAADKILASLPSGMRTTCTQLTEVIAVRWPAMVDAHVARRVFQTLQEAAAEHRKVRILYDLPAEKREVSLVVHPYALALLNRMWTMVGCMEACHRVQSFSLDRIQSVSVLPDVFSRPSNFSLDDYIGRAWCAVPEGVIWPVRLCFAPGVAADVEEIVWHKTQQTQRLPNGSLLYEAQVDGLAEITQWILGFGDQVVVETPLELRDRIRTIARRTAQQYEG